MTTPTKMTTEEFLALGQSLYGANWRTKLANAFVREVRTVRRWGTGESPVPAKVSRKLRAMAEEKGISKAGEE